MSRTSFKLRIGRALLRLPAWLLALSARLSALAILSLDRGNRDAVLVEMETVASETGVEVVG